MISTQTVPLFQIERLPWRNTFSLNTGIKPLAAEHVFRSLVDRVRAGATLLINVAEITPGMYTVIDGHFNLEVYEYMNKFEVTVIVHDDVKTEEQARDAYIALNYLRASDWLRSGVKLREALVAAGESKAVHLMEDPDLAVDLIKRSQERWDAFVTVVNDGSDPEQPLLNFGE